MIVITIWPEYPHPVSIFNPHASLKGFEPMPLSIHEYFIVAINIDIACSVWMCGGDHAQTVFKSSIESNKDGVLISNSAALQ